MIQITQADLDELSSDLNIRLGRWTPSAKLRLKFYDRCWNETRAHNKEIFKKIEGSKLEKWLYADGFVMFSQNLERELVRGFYN